MRLLEPGQIFAERYRVVSFLASGGMGAVFVAMHLVTEMKVALKVLNPEVLSSSAARERFELEARVAARVKSDHIVQVLDAGTDSATRLPFIVMELLEGKSLEELVHTNGPLPAPALIETLRQVAAGLELAHGYREPDGTKKPIVHRDLKPENLFIIGPNSDAPLVKILDFGIAKVLSDTANVSQELRGTPLYMAYEQATGEAVTPATDVWALGLIAFFGLTGRPYWKSVTLPEGTVASLFSEILSLPMAPASERAKDLGIDVALPAGFDGWFARCVARRPEARYEHAKQAVAALAALCSGAAFDDTVQARIVTARNFPLASIPSPTPEFDATMAALAGSTTGQLAVETAPRLPLPLQNRRGLYLAVAAMTVAATGTGYLLLDSPSEPGHPAATDSVALPTADASHSAVQRVPTAEVLPSAPSATPPAVTPLSAASPGAVAEETPPTAESHGKKPASPHPTSKQRVDDPYGKR